MVNVTNCSGFPTDWFGSPPLVWFDGVGPVCVVVVVVVAPIVVVLVLGPLDVVIVVVV